MAFAPCTVHGGGFKGGASTFFPALVQNGARASIRHKTCPDCATKFHDWALEHLQLVSEGEVFYPQEQPLYCANCRGALKGTWAFFLNEYLRGEPDRQFYGQVCGDCMTSVATDWLIPW
jgi:hypothetical protein